MPQHAGQHVANRLDRLRSAGNYLNLSTPAGLLVATLGRATLERRPNGLILGEHYRLKFPVAGAFTIGNVILTSGQWDELEGRYPQLLVHEEVHTWQYLYCLGLPYYLAYSACMGWSMLRTGDRAAGNFFERQAGLVRGGYVELPNQSWGATISSIGPAVRRLWGSVRRRR